ncbi:MAG: MYXO-CTERM sorting domain-containing protein [Byssovorax sp.]
MRHPLVTPFLLGSVLFLGCGVESVPADGERLGASDSAIINGSPDVTHTAVVAVLAPDFECSGTVLQVKGTTGYVLTAAHCCPANDLPIEVVVGPDYTTGISHPIVPGSIVKDPCYQDYPGSTDDVCMLKFKNATGVPTIPPMTPQSDTLAVGTPITYVGYGITAAPPGGGNSLRRYVNKTVGKVDTYFVEYASPGQSGTCEGDSGGPGLVVVNGQEQVASVTSYGDNMCNQLGSSIRTSAVYTSFIAPFLADQAPNPSCPAATDCNACSQSVTQNGGCVNVTNTCFQDPQCSALAQCYQGCGSSACIATCNNAHVGGLTKYVAIETCICAGCPQACGTTSTCIAPKCGLKVVDTTCTACVETGCCAEAWECQNDTTCKKCFTAGTPPAACAANAKAAAYYACAKNKCACSVKDPALAGGTTAASSSAATTGSGEMTTSGAGGSGGAAGTIATTTTAGVGGGAAASSAESGTGGSGAGSAAVGGCGCTTADSSRGSTAPFAALALVAAGILARRRRSAA